MRLGITLIELIIVTLIVSIGAAVVVPNWISHQESVRLTSAALAVTSDFRALRTHASHSSRPLSVRFQDSVLTVSPPIPELMGDAQGRIDYSIRYPDVKFNSASTPGGSEFDIDIRGDLYFSSSDPIHPSVRATEQYVTLVLGSMQKKVLLQENLSTGPDDSTTTPIDSNGTDAASSSTLAEPDTLTSPS